MNGISPQRTIVACERLLERERYRLAQLRMLRSTGGSHLDAGQIDRGIARCEALIRHLQQQISEARRSLASLPTPVL